MNKKLNKFEIKSLARTIINEANETINLQNETTKNSKKYLDAVQKIKDANPLNKLEKEFRKLAKIELGTKEGEELEIKVGSYSNEFYRKEKEDLNELNKKSLKKKINISLEKLEDELILAQVSSKSLTTLKALKISELTK